MAVLAPRTPEEVAEAVRSCPRLLPVGARTKPPLSRVPEGVEPLSLAELRGIREYQPAEFTVTALAGTPVAEVSAALAEQGQFLPFDPPLVARGATLGGAVAAGISGSGRQRYGGVRDFLIGISLVDGDGAAVRGGGKVVKNAAGFDLPKLMVGSLGALGVLVELTFKVFPRPACRTTLRFEVDGFETGHRLALRLAAAPVELDALDLALGEEGWRLLVRLGGLEQSLAERARRVEGLLALGAERLDGDEDGALWSSVREAEWAPSSSSLVRVPVTPQEARALERELAENAESSALPRRYTAGGAVLWLAWPSSFAPTRLETLLSSLGLVGQAVTGDFPAALIGEPKGFSLYRRVRSALDPGGRFLGIDERVLAPSDGGR